MSSTIRYCYLIDETTGDVIDIQHPLPTDGDSIYAKDIWNESSITTDWKDEDGDESVDNILIPFTNLHTVMSNITTDNPKLIRVHLNRSVNSHQVGLGAHSGNFSNVKITLLGSGGVERTVVDDSANAAKYTSRNYPFEPQLFNAIDIEFHTADPVSISNITAQKSSNVGAQIQGLRADGTIGTVNLTNGNNLKMSLEELESGISSNSNSQLNVTPYNSAGLEQIIDPSTNVLVTLTEEEYRIHSGDHYFIGSHTTLADEGVLDLVIITPNTATRMHYTAQVTSSTAVVIGLYEGITTSADGAASTSFNSDRNSSNIAAVTIHEAATVTDTGTLMRVHAGGSTGPFGVGTSARSTSENIFAQNTKYLIRITSGANANVIDWEIVWYEVG